MVTLTVNINPPLTGVRGEMWIMLLVGGVGYWYRLINVPTSVNGVVGPFGYADGYPFNIHQIRFPEQTIEGVTYYAAETNGFTLYENWTFNVILTPKEEIIVVGTSITLRLSPSTVEPNGVFTWSGKLSRADGVDPGIQTITLLLNDTAVGSTTCDVNGNFSVTSIAPSAQASYSYRTHFGGATLTLERLEASVSPEIMHWGIIARLRPS